MSAITSLDHLRDVLREEGINDLGINEIMDARPDWWQSIDEATIRLVAQRHLTKYPWLRTQ